MLTLLEFRDQIFEHYQERGVLINNEHYGEMPCDELMVAIWSKDKDERWKGVVLSHNNACPLTGAHMLKH
jgi:hypothetical protein